MTVVLTIARPFCIVMASDGAVREEFDNGLVSYAVGPKSFEVPEVGVVTTYGARDGNKIEEFVGALAASKAIHRVDELALQVHRYLVEDYNPKAMGLADVGFHIAGFLHDKPLVFHSFWQTPGTGRPVDGSYEFESHFPGQGIFTLYNGRSDLAHKVVESILDEIREHRQAPTTTLSTGMGLVSYAHLALRFASEVSPDVGPPFLVRVIAPDNKIYTQRLPDAVPFGNAEFDTLRRFANIVEGMRFIEKPGAV